MVSKFRGALALCCWLSTAAAADDLRIQSRVTIGGGEIARENLTLFHQEQVYDFMSQPATVTIFDPTERRFVLLDPARRRKSEVTVETLDQFLEELRREASQSENPLLKFLSRPEFRESETAEGEMLLASSWMSYRMQTVPVHNREESRRYREFSDGFARLNTLTNPASLPPFARLAVNAALDRRGALPTEVQLTIVTQTTPVRKEITYTSRHQIQWRLLEDDLGRISQAESDREAFSPLAIEQFLGGGEPTAERPATSRRR